MKFRLFRMSWKARGNLRCIFNIIFCLFSFQQSQENPPQSWLQSDKEEDRSTTESESEHSEHSSDTADMNFCDEKDMRFIRTHCWIFRSKKELLKFVIWKRKSNAMLSLGALHLIAMCTFISRQRKINSRMTFHTVPLEI